MTGFDSAAALNSETIPTIAARVIAPSYHFVIAVGKPKEHNRATSMRLLFAVVAIVAYVISCGFSSAQESSPPAEEQTSISPDKKWEYSDGNEAKLVKAGTNEVALEFSEGCDLGALDEHSGILWAPDSKRLAFYSCGAGKEHNTLLYQLRDDHWVALEGPRDELFQRAGEIIEAQAKRKGLPKKTFLHMQWWTVKSERWLDSSTLIVYASMAEVAHRYDGEYAGLDFGADLLVTLKFDTAGKWKIVKTHRMSKKEVEEHK